MKWQVEWNFTAVFPEIHISDHELLFERGLFEGTILLVDILGYGLFTTKREIIKAIRISYPVALM